MGISEAVVLLAGFVLAHAAWSISDVPVGELLVPLAVIERSGTRYLQRFEGPTQDAAIASGKDAVAEATTRGETWAFAREGLLNEATGKVDVITVEFWSSGMDSPVTLVQRFRAAASPTGFAILGEPEVSIGNRIQPPEAMAPLLKIVREGIKSHGKAGPQWGTWQTQR